MKLTHTKLCDIAVKWLKRPISAGGSNCKIAVSEVKSGFSGEIPDAIGFRHEGPCEGAYVVEVKVSRSDFLADKKKPHRNGTAPGIGKYRYYMAPEGVISIDELPAKWGLIEVNSRGHCRVLQGLAKGKKPHYGPVNDWQFSERNINREMFILIVLLARVGDPEEVNKKLKAAWRQAEEWKKMYMQQRRETQKYNLVPRKNTTPLEPQ